MIKGLEHFGGSKGATSLYMKIINVSIKMCYLTYNENLYLKISEGFKGFVLIVMYFYIILNLRKKSIL